MAESSAVQRSRQSVGSAAVAAEPRDFPPADILPTKSAREIDPLDRAIGHLTGGRHVGTKRGDGEHSTTIGDERAAARRGACVEDLGAAGLRLVEPSDRAALVGGAG